MIKIIKGFTNSYLIIDKKTILIDPGLVDEFDKKLKIIKEYVDCIDFIFLTHGHYDHYSSCYLFEEEFGCITYIHENDLKFLFGEDPSLKLFQVNDSKLPKNVEIYDKLDINFMQIIHTPGHTPGSVSFIYKNYLISGDTLFCNGIGRTDLGGNISALKRSLNFLFKTIKEKNIEFLLPGHGNIC
jgi:glyoxylase-like metal-dependent hydrolase (beta-lactamase superfamily II)